MCIRDRCDLQQSHVHTGGLLGRRAHLGGKALAGLVDLAQVAIQAQALHCLLYTSETQHYPCSPSHPEFPTTVLRAGKVFRATPTLRFFTGKQCGKL